MHPYSHGVRAAFDKLGELSPAIKALLEHILIGGAAGGTTGGISGAIAAPEGKRLEGAGKGIAVGALAGGALGPLAGHFGGGKGYVDALGPYGPTAGGYREGLRMPLSGLVTAPAGALAGGVGGALAAPPEDTIKDKLMHLLGR